MKKIILIAINAVLDIGGYFLWNALALAERGYKGVGGEWLLILGLPALWGYLTWEYMIRHKEADKNEAGQIYRLLRAKRREDA